MQHKRLAAIDFNIKLQGESMTSTSVSSKESEFIEAANNWNLEKLYVDMASAKGKGLTPVEKKLLRGLLCGYSPSEIAERVYKSRSSSAVRVYLSNGLYRYIQELLARKTGEVVKIKNWSRVTNLLEKAGYKNKVYNLASLTDYLSESDQSDIVSEIKLEAKIRKYQDWEEDIDIKSFYGRTEEVNELKHWILKENTRLIGLLGVGGVGKTTLAVSTIEQVQQDFEFSFWRSLRHSPPLEELITNLIQFLGNGEEASLPASSDGRIALLMSYLRSHRCLLVLDHVEAVLRSGEIAGTYREGYEGYGEFFKRLGQEYHSSCVIITSREKPKEIAFLEGKNLPVRCLELAGLKKLALQEMLSVKGLIGSSEDYKALTKHYGGNPLALEIITTTIKNIFDGNIKEFLDQGILIFGEVCQLLEQQFNRLSELEKKVMYCLVIHHKLVPIRGLSEEVVPGISKREHLEAFESLRRRSLIVKNSTTWLLPPLFRAYIVERLAQQVCNEMNSEEIAILMSRLIINSLLRNTTTDGTLERNRSQLESAIESDKNENVWSN